MDSAANTGSRKRKAYTIKLKLEACEYAEQSSNEKAAKHFQVGLYCVRLLLTDYIPVQHWVQ